MATTTQTSETPSHEIVAAILAGAWTTTIREQGLVSADSIVWRYREVLEALRKPKSPEA